MNTAEIDLFLGVFIGSEALVRKSWQAGANINAVNGFGETPLINAVQDGHESIVSSVRRRRGCQFKQYNRRHSANQSG